MKNEERIVKVEKRDTHNAISSWSGYDYQGKVAIYWVMHLINQMDISATEISDYSLEIEHLEDFTIKLNSSPFSIHQVKSYQDKATISPYKEAILEMMGKCAKYDSITSIHLHTCCFILAPNKEELKTTLSQLTPAKKVEQFKEYKELLFEKENYDEVYKKLFLNNHSKPPSKRVIDILDIDNEIKSEIRKFYKKNHASLQIKFSDSEENINFIFHNFVHEINQFVSARHKKKINKPEISFDVFLEILKNEFVFKFSQKTATSILKFTLEEYFKEYCENEDLNLKECENWNENWKTICSLSDEEFLLLCKKLSPNLNIKTKEITQYDYKELIVKPGVHKSLIPMVLEAGGFALEIEGLSELFVLNKEGMHHLITTIAEVSGKNTVNIQGKKVFDSLKNDNELTTLLFDIHKLITNELEGQFDGTIVDVGQAYQEFPEELEIRETITVPKKLEFITVDTAKGVFK
ncbi:ABC-three component system protein [Rossellomorea sp. GCM10028870]|uniref:ABC-three component system protein n=1 Tax=Rossellomorea sp. GCM10028870 TaxID=3273426 RepID=UPI00361A8948